MLMQEVNLLNYYLSEGRGRLEIKAPHYHHPSISYNGCGIMHYRGGRPAMGMQNGGGEH